MRHESTGRDTESERRAATDDDAVSNDDPTAAPSVVPTATVTATRTRGDDTAEPANVVTIIGHDTPSSFEITVDGEIDVLEAERPVTSTVVSGSTIEGTIESDTIRFAFTGELTDVTFVDRQITGFSPATAPNVHVDYAAPERTQS